MGAETAPAGLELIGHACLGITVGGRRILVDPWLSGSCFWRSWWHFPGPPEVPAHWLEPDAVYLSHHHFDHFHYPSMRRISRSATVYVPRFGVDVLEGELHRLGFHDVVELPHGEVLTVGNGGRIASYQHGFDDSALVVADGDTVIVDLNDCKLRGRPLAEVVEDFGPPTFMFRTHSWAQSYPILYEAEDPTDLALVSDETFLVAFADAAAVLQPRYAVPFANMVAFLHPQSMVANQHLITPDRVAGRCETDPRLAHTEVVPMGPGDSWNVDDGFQLSERPWWADRPATLGALERQVDEILVETARQEAEVDLPFGDLRAYLEDFAAALPRALRRAFFRRSVVFAAPWDEARPWWVFDLRGGTLRRATNLPDDRASTIWIDAAVLADAIDKRILHMVHGSMRIRTQLRDGGASDDLGFWGLLMVWEIGYLPMRELATVRFAGTLARRWREAADVLQGLVGRRKGSPLERLAAGFAAPED